MKKLNKKRPTIAELEAAIAQGNPPEIMPDGSVQYTRCSDTKETVEEKREFVAAQMREAMATKHVMLRDGHKIPLWFAYRCLYCGECFNQSGAEEHFGITREAYFARQDELVIHGEE